MDVVLLVITVASLALAFTMSLLAWRLLKAERARTTTRVDTLRTMAFASDESHVAGNERPSSRPLESAPIAANAYVERKRDSGRTDERVTSDEPSMAWDMMHPAPEGVHHTEAVRDDMFEPASQEGVAGRRWLALAAVALLMAAGVATVSALNSPEIAAAVAASRNTPAAGGTAAFEPLELLSLRYAQRDGMFTVTGRVQNPAHARAVSDIVAVVSLFDNADRNSANGRAPLEHVTLEAGDVSAFTIRIPDTGDVHRYRVGFRRNDGGTISHVDRRPPSASAASDVSIDSSGAAPQSPDAAIAEGAAR